MKTHFLIMKKLVYLSVIAFLCSCNQQTKQQAANSSKDSTRIVKEEVAVADSATDEEMAAVADSATDEEMAQRMAEYEAEYAETDEDYTPLELEQRAEEAALRARGEEMLAKLASIEEQINNIRNGEFSRSMQSVLYFRRKGTYRMTLDYSCARKEVMDCCNEMIGLYQSAMVICRDYNRMDLYNLYGDEITKLNNILDEL